MTVVFLGEEPTERGSDDGAIGLNDDRQVTQTAPALVIAGELRVLDHEFERRQLPLMVPRHRLVERTFEVREIAAVGSAKLDHRKCSQPPSSYGSSLRDSEMPAPSSQRPTT